MAMTPEHYAEVAQKLIPLGLAWNRSPNGTLYRLLSSFAENFSRVEVDAEALLKEMHPQWSTQMLSEWEALLDLPECGLTNQSLKERQDASGNKWHCKGSLNYRFYEIWLKEIYGYTVTIVERHPHHCLRPCNYPLWSREYQWLVEVHIKGKDPWRYWNVTDTPDLPLRIGQESILECLLGKYKPAHIQWLFIHED